jgi:hypothetical protein
VIVAMGDPQVYLQSYTSVFMHELGHDFSLGHNGNYNPEEIVLLIIAEFIEVL